ncbi:transcription initiation factor TFIID subunit 5-like isoform X1 [Drosophila pseudoobscura]|uniref:Transcription initiation factor TFIID subunit 5-like isoform X1 n=1 Tax=Drosophila pseudoobscura pseudoobscura TaxID=46245 RepID=A0A6I8V957_DROPS|nr:transcription initiation factor TFIID subunit 5 isoform X1 [Drosophila pseudoobscura]
MNHPEINFVLKQNQRPTSGPMEGAQKESPKANIFLCTVAALNEQVVTAIFSDRLCMMALGTSDSVIYMFELNLIVSRSNGSEVDEVGMDPSNSDDQFTLRGLEGPLYDGAFCQKCKYFVSCAVDFTVRLWCLSSRCILFNYIGHSWPIRSVVFTANGLFATASHSGIVTISKMDSIKPYRQFSAANNEPLTACLLHPAAYTYYCIVGCLNGAIRIWDYAGQCFEWRVFRGHKSAVTVLALSNCTFYLASGDASHITLVWDVRYQWVIRSLGQHLGPIRSIDFSLDNNLLVIGAGDKYRQLSIWDFKSLKQAEPQKKACNVSPLSNEHLLVFSHVNVAAPIAKIRFITYDILMGVCVDIPHVPWRNRSQISWIDRKCQMNAFLNQKIAN